MADAATQARRAFPDTSVLSPISLLDLMMRLAEHRIHDLVWSDDLLDELDRTWREGRAAGKRVPNETGAAAALAGIRRTFNDTRMDRASYQHLVDTMPGTDEDDRLHSAAARAGDATHIVTTDRAGGFPVAELAAFGLRVQAPDDYLTEIARELPTDCRRIVSEMVEQRRQRDPTLSVDQLVERWRSRVGLTHFCEQLMNAEPDVERGPGSGERAAHPDQPPPQP